VAEYTYLTQDLLTGTFLDTDLPLSGVKLTYELNGPGALTASITPHYVRVNPASLVPGRTAIYAERGGVLQWGGIIWSTQPQGPDYAIEASGFSSYLSRRHDLHGNANARGPWVYADPCQVYRDLWAYAQEQPDGDLSVAVDATTSVAKVGTPAEPFKLDWWEAPNLGEAANTLSQADDGFDYTDAVSWTGSIDDPGVPLRRIRLGYPRLGRRRTDISFRTGVNVIAAPAVTYDADNYAQVLIGLGAGEGSARIRSTLAIRNDFPRLEHVEQQPSFKGTDQLASFLRTEAVARTQLASLPALTAVDHPSARVGSFDVGDDVLVEVHDEWTDLELWCRIVSYSVSTGEEGETIELDLARADSFHYGAPA
jgi:hypothetical protein